MCNLFRPRPLYLPIPSPLHFTSPGMRMPGERRTPEPPIRFHFLDSGIEIDTWDTHLGTRSPPNPLPRVWSISWQILNELFFASHLAVVSSFAKKLSTLSWSYTSKKGCVRNIDIVTLKIFSNLSC